MEELEAENFDLKITNKGKDYFIERLKEQTEKERQAYIDERKLLIDQLTTATKQIGQLETQLLQPGRVHNTTIIEEDEERREANSGHINEPYDRHENNLKQNGIDPDESKYRHVNEGNDMFNV